jgi:hypothetical protein
MNGRRLASLALALGILAAPPGASAAETPAWTAASSPAYASDLRAYLDSVRWYERSIATVPRTGEPLEREIITGFLASMTADQYYARAMPVFARHIQPRDAQTLGAMARRKPVPLGTQQAALKAYWAMEKTVGPELAPVWRDLVAAYSRRMHERMVAEIRRGIADLAAHRGTGYKVAVNRVGLPTLDRIAWLVVHNNVQQTNALQVMDQHCRGGAMAIAFLPSTLMASNGPPVARKALDDCEGALETTEKSNEAAYNELRDGLRGLHLPEKSGLAQELETGSRSYYEFHMKLGEMNRQMLQDHRNLLNLVEAKRDHIHLQDDRLMFDSEDDLAEMNRIVGEIQALSTSINDTVYRHRQSGLLHDIDMHDGVKADGEAAPLKVPAG